MEKVDCIKIISSGVIYFIIDPTEPLPILVTMTMNTVKSEVKTRKEIQELLTALN